MAADHPSLRRILDDTDLSRGVDRLVDLNAQDLTTVLLHVFDRRTASVEPADVVSRSTGRFTVPSRVPADQLAALRSAGFASLDGFEPVELAPVVPLGTHAALGGVDQTNVVSAVRGLELAADPTVGLALEAVHRRRNLLAVAPRSNLSVRLAASQRITRAQQFDGPRSFAHFELVAAVIAGRAGPGRTMEAEAAVELLGPLCQWAAATTGVPVRLRLTDLEGRGDVIDRLTDALASATVAVEPWSERTAGRAYYQTLCFKIDVALDDEIVEVGDGGFVDWTARMMENRKERLLTGAVSPERLAALSSNS